MLRTVYLGVVLLVFSASALAQDSPRPLADAFFATIMQGQIPAAYNKLFDGSTIKKDKPQAIDQLRRQTEVVQNTFGKFLGPELLREERLGTSLVRLVYLLKSEKHLTVWEFYFYKPKGAWIVSQIQFNDNFNLLDAKNRN